MAVPYLNFNYIFPPRPEFKIPPTDLFKFDNGEYLAQPKYNGTCCVVFTNGIDTLVYNRKKQPLSKYSADIDFKGLAMTEKWSVYVGEYLNKAKKGETGIIERDKFIIWDILVHEGEYLINEPLNARLDLLEILYPSIRGKVDANGIMEIYTHICLTNLNGIYKVPSYTNQFEKLFANITKTDLYEGLVLKKIDSKLGFGFQELNNNDWQVKCRKATKVYNF